MTLNTVFDDLDSHSGRRMGCTANISCFTCFYLACSYLFFASL